MIVLEGIVLIALGRAHNGLESMNEWKESGGLKRTYKEAGRWPVPAAVVMTK